MLEKIFEPGTTGVSPFAIVISLYLAYYVHNDAEKHNVPHGIWWAVGTFFAWIIFSLSIGLTTCAAENNQFFRIYNLTETNNLAN